MTLPDRIRLRGTPFAESCNVPGRPGWVHHDLRFWVKRRHHRPKNRRERRMAAQMLAAGEYAYAATAYPILACTAPGVVGRIAWENNE